MRPFVWHQNRENRKFLTKVHFFHFCLKIATFVKIEKFAHHGSELDVDSQKNVTFVGIRLCRKKIQIFQFSMSAYMFAKSMPTSDGRHSAMCGRREKIPVSSNRSRRQLSNDISYPVQLHLCSDIWGRAPCMSKMGIFGHFWPKRPTLTGHISS